MSSQQLDEERIFHVAREISKPAARAEYLEQICAGDQALRERVESLLEVHEQEQSFLKSDPNHDSAETRDHPPTLEGRGTTIGRYRLMEQIGEGGMGTVFVAQQERPIRQKVALKVIKPGMDSQSVIARFEAERQALALMDHPNIAKVLDAGTTQSGRPYFAMELVPGVPITEYCDRNRLTVDERLELFIPICKAIQHAHHKGIIHRDIKPSNVLITLHDGKPVPKVIDFGVAKSLGARLTDRTIYTEHFQIVGTLLYMSPEQAELSGLGVDTRSDVYSLGVLLYELLTGTTPFQKADLDQAGFDEQRRIIREQEPPRASERISNLGETATTVAEHRRTDARKLNQQVRGDLDWILHMALEKDRTRRYESPKDFAQDVTDYLVNEPVKARPPTIGYRAAKYLRRNRVAIAVTGLLLASLTLGLIGTAWQARVAWRETRETGRQTIIAEEALDDARLSEQEANDSLYFALVGSAWDAWRVGNMEESKRLLDQATAIGGQRGPELSILRNQQQWAADLDHFATDRTASGLAVSPDGNWLAARSGRTLTLFGLEDESIEDLKIDLQADSKGRSGLVSFSHDSKHVIACDFRSTSVRVHEVAGPRKDAAWSWKSPDRTVKVVSAQLSPSDDLVAVATHDGMIYVMDWGKDEVIWSRRVHEPIESGDSLTADGPTVAVGRVETVYSVAISKYLAFSKDGSTLVCGTGIGKIVAWEVKTGKEVAKMEQLRPLRSLAISPDGKRIAVSVWSKSHGIHVWSVETSDEITQLPGHDGIVSQVIFLPNGDLASCGRDNVVRVWDGESYRQKRAFRGHSAYIWSITVSPDGSKLFTGADDRKIIAWPVDAPAAYMERITERDNQIFDLKLNVAAQELIGSQLNSNQISIWDIDSFRLKRKIALRVGVRSIEVIDKNRVAVRHLDGSVGMLDLKSGSEESPFHQQLSKGVTGFAYSPDQRLLAASVATPAGIELIVLESDGRFWKLATTRPFDAGQIRNLAWSPNGSWLAGVSGNEVIAWDQRNGWEEYRFGEHTKRVECVTFSPNAAILASCGQDSTIRIWDLETKDQLGEPLKGHAGIVWNVLFSGSGEHLYSASGDGTVGIWDVASHRLRARLPGQPDGAKALALATDDAWLATGGIWEGMLQVWKIKR